MRSLSSNVFLISAAISFTVGGVCMKSSVGLTRIGPSLLMSLLFLIGAALQALAMRDADMSVSYVFVLGLESLFAFALGVLTLGETVSAARLCAIFLITAGVVLLHR